MGWSVGYDSNWKRDIGHGVPATCDAPGCKEKIDRGLGYVCGGEPYGGDHGCGLFFCSQHRYCGKYGERCKRCEESRKPYKRPSADLPEWIEHKLTDESWQEWRKDNPKEVAQLRKTK